MSSDIDPGIAGLSGFRRIGSGGFSTVYVAWEADFNRWVAVKILHDLDESAERHFQRERRLMGQSSGHPNVTTPIRSGLTVDGKPYLVMQYMEGGSLQDTIDRGELLHWRDAVALMRPIADALGDSHEHGILHKDVKPANILLARNGTPTLTDFGIAGILGSTATRMAFTFAHAPPETFSGGVDGRDARSDLYSLASTLYTVIAGRSPFERGGEDSQLAYMNRIANHPVPRLDLDPGLDQFLATALAKDPDHRPQNAREFIDGLDRVLAGRPPIAAADDPVISAATILRSDAAHTNDGAANAHGVNAHGANAPTDNLLADHPVDDLVDRRRPPDDGRRLTDALGWVVAALAIVGVGVAAWFAFLRDPTDPATETSTETGEGVAAAPTTSASAPSTDATPAGDDGAPPAEVQAAIRLLADPASDVPNLLSGGLLPTTNVTDGGFTFNNCETQLVALQTAFGGRDLPQLREQIAQWPAGAPDGYVDPAQADRGFRERLEAYVVQTETGYGTCFEAADIAPVGTHVLSGLASIQSFFCVTGAVTEIRLRGEEAGLTCPVTDELALCGRILDPLLIEFFLAFPDSKPDPAAACQAAITDDPALFAQLP